MRALRTLRTVAEFSLAAVIVVGACAGAIGAVVGALYGLGWAVVQAVRWLMGVV